MPSYESYIGSKINRLTIVGVLPAVKGRHRRFECMCECGGKLITNASRVISGNTRSCGCLAKEAHTKHGLSGTVLYDLWSKMISRCRNPADKSYNGYGGRGITVCAEWGDVVNFVEWAKGKWKRGLQIDRIDNDKGYSPDNCRFVTAETNANNKGVHKSNALGITGLKEHSGKYRAYVRSNRLPGGKQRYLGTYSTLEEALEARNKFILDNNLPHRIQELKNA